jgi:MFS family permease
MSESNATHSPISTEPDSIWHVRDFPFYLGARFLMTVAIQIQSLAVGWQVYELTKDPLALGLIGLAEVIPAVSVSLFAGHIADTRNRRMIIVSCLTMLAFCSLMFLVLTLKPVTDFFPPNVYVLYGIVFLTGVGRGFMSPAGSAFSAQVLPAHLYRKAAPIFSASFETGSIMGPAIGGLLYGFIGATWTYAADLVLILIALTLTLCVSPKPTPAPHDAASVTESLRAGLQFVFKSEIILGAFALDMFAVFFGGAVALLPIFAGEILHVGAIGLGVLRAAPSLGAVCMALWLSKHPISHHAGKKLFAAIAGFGACMIVFGLSTNLYLSLAALFFSGLCDNVSVVIRSLIFQVFTPDAMRGRVASVNQIFIASSNELGAFESGVAAKLLTVVPSVVFGGAMTIGIVGITAATAKKLWRLNFEP